MRALPSLPTTRANRNPRSARPPALPEGAASWATVNILYAIHIVRGEPLRSRFRLIETVRLRSSLETAQKRACSFLLGYPDLMSDDFVLVRVAADGREVFRWPAAPDLAR